jgi:hypothetical protein
LKTNFSGRFYKNVDSVIKVKVLFYPMLPDLRKDVPFWKVPRLRPFALVREIHRRRRVWTIDGMMTGVKP